MTTLGLRLLRRARLLPGQTSLRVQVGVSVPAVWAISVGAGALFWRLTGSLICGLAAQAFCVVALGWAAALAIAAPLERLARDAEQPTPPIGEDTRGLRVRGCLEGQRLSRALRSTLRRLEALEQKLADADAQANSSSDRFARQIENLRRLADTDPLTGLLNRRGFFNAVQNPQLGPVDSLGVLIVDIDNFKRVNDGYGHAVGDEVIRAVASAIQGTVRQNDVVARLGGEEFAVVAPGAPDTLELLAERIRAAAEQAGALGGLSVSVTVSVGASVCSGRQDGIQDMIDRADAALYQAKQSGRNCVRVHR